MAPAPASGSEPGRFGARWDQALGLGRRIVEHPANRDHRLRALARAGRWQVRKRVWARPADIEFEGYVLRCHRDNSSASNVWYFTSRYDHAEMTFLDRYLRPGDRALDVGANIGTYALFMARRVGPAGRVVAVEAEPRTVGRLRFNVERNGLADLVQVCAVAVDAVPGTVPFFVDLDVANGIAADGDRRGSSVEVTAVRLDDLVPDRDPIAVAKLDVEGVEVRALEGASGLLAERRPPVWITEVLEPQLRWFGATASDLVASFGSAGFEPYRFEVGTGRLVPLAGPIKGNAIFVATDRLDAVEDRLAERRRV